MKIKRTSYDNTYHESIRPVIAGPHLSSLLSYRKWEQSLHGQWSLEHSKATQKKDWYKGELYDSLNFRLQI